MKLLRGSFWWQDGKGGGGAANEVIVQRTHPI